MQDLDLKDFVIVVFLDLLKKFNLRSLLNFT